LFKPRRKEFVQALQPGGLISRSQNLVNQNPPYFSSRHTKVI